MRKQQHRRTSAKSLLPRAISLLLFFVAVSPAAAQDEVARVSATWQVVSYDLDVRMAQPDTNRGFAATAKLSLKNVSARPASTLTLRISSSAEVSAVTINGGAVQFTKSEEKIGTGALQRIVLRVPPVAPAGSVTATVDYKLTVKDNSGLNSLTPIGSQFLPLSYWYPTPNSWYFARGADYAPFRLKVNIPGQTVVSSGTETSGVFDEKLNGQPFFLTGNWETANVSGVTVLMPKGAGAGEQKVAGELAALASEARSFVSNLLGAAPVDALRLVSVKRAGGFAGGGTILVDDGVFRRGRIDALTAMSVADGIAKMWLGSATSVSDDGSGTIREGLTKFIATQFLESRFGKDIADVERHRQRAAYAAVSRRDAPMTVVSPLDDYYYATVSNKGAMVWRVIAKKVGNEEFFKGIRAAIQDGSVSLAEIRAQFPAEKEILDHLFDQVTETNLLAGLPQAGSGATRVALRNTGPIDVTVNVLGVTANGERIPAPATVRAKSFGEITFRTPNRIVRVEIDPEKFYPQTDYSDDVAPRETTDNDLLLAVKRSFDKQEFANAEKTARTVLRDFPRLDDVRVLLGRSLLAQGRTADAEREFRAVLDEKLPTARSIAWANVGLAELASKNGQNPQAVKFAVDAINADGEYGASLAARGIRNRAGVGSAADESVNAFFAGFDRAATSNRKADLDALAMPGEVSRFVSGISGQTVEWKTDVLHVDRIDANNVWVEATLNVRLLNRPAETGTAVYRLTRVGSGWRLSSVDMFEVR